MSYSGLRPRTSPNGRVRWPPNPTLSHARPPTSSFRAEAHATAAAALARPRPLTTSICSPGEGSDDEHLLTLLEHWQRPTARREAHPTNERRRFGIGRDQPDEAHARRAAGVRVADGRPRLGVVRRHPLEGWRARRVRRRVGRRRRRATERATLGLARLVEVLMHVDPIAPVNATPAHVLLDVRVVLDVAARLRSVAAQAWRASACELLVARGRPVPQELRLAPVALLELAVAVARQQLRVVEGVAFGVVADARADPPLCQARRPVARARLSRRAGAEACVASAGGAQGRPKERAAHLATRGPSSAKAARRNCTWTARRSNSPPLGRGTASRSR
eukprot:scaffold18764_cov53-Phaeocystis_antarctica.AAC.3